MKKYIKPESEVLVNFLAEVCANSVNGDIDVPSIGPGSIVEDGPGILGAKEIIPEDDYPSDW